MNKEELRIAVAVARGWIWYRIPKDPLNKDREYRMLAHPSIHEYDGQSKEWIVRADGTERICNIEFMNSNGYLPSLDMNSMHSALMDENKQFRLRFETIMDNHLAGIGKLWCEADEVDYATIFLEAKK